MVDLADKMDGLTFLSYPNTLFLRSSQMVIDFRYGIDSSVLLERPTGAWTAQCGILADLPEPQSDAGAATTRALDEPLGYPPFSRTVLPEDRVVLVLDEGVPRAGEVAAAVIGRLVDGGVDPDSVFLLRTQADVEAGLADPRPWLTGEVKDRLTLLVHDPLDRDGLAFLATSKSGEALLLNRAITDADVVLPIGCFRDRPVAGHYGIHSPIFPRFADEENQMRFRAADSLDAAGRHRKKIVQVVDEVGWLLGVAFTIQVIPGPGGSVLDVLAGEVGAVRQRGQSLFDAAWRTTVPRKADLVVAAVEGPADQQNWLNLARALTVAARLVEDEGAIAVCSDLAAVPGVAVGRLATAPSRAEALEEIRRESPTDTLAAVQLARVLDRSRVYLLSRLKPAIVESLDMAPISGDDELVRLVGRHESCIVVGNAPYARVSVT